MVRQWNKSYEQQIYTQCVVLNQRMQTYNKTVLDPLRPDERYALPAVDYKRQKARGTLVEGADFYIPDAHAQNRLARPFEPYTEQEQEARKEYRYQRYLSISTIVWFSSPLETKAHLWSQSLALTIFHV